MKIAVVGSCNIDLTFRVAHLPTAGETLPAARFQLAHGGKGANQAVMAARLGAEVAMIARVGDDAFGNDVISQLRAEGIDVSQVRRQRDSTTGSAVILVDATGRNSIVVVGGANQDLAPFDVLESVDTIRSADVLLCQLEVPLPTSYAALKLAHAAGVRTIFNPAPAIPLWDNLLTHVDVCIPNELEFGQLTGLPVASRSQIETAAQMLRQRGARIVIVTLGERGALIVDGKSSELIPVPKVSAVDTSGAGDAFTGAFAVAWVESGSMHEAVVRANAVAADTVTRLGTQTSFPAARRERET